MSTATSQQTLIDGLEENLAAYDEPWGTAVAPNQSEVSQAILLLLGSYVAPDFHVMLAAGQNKDLNPPLYTIHFTPIG